MISKRCTGFNLLNHIKQKYDYKINYRQIMNIYSEHHTKWLVTFEFNNRVYEVIRKTKKEGVEKILESAYVDIYQVINIKQ